MAGETYQVRMTKIVLAVPFDGEKDIFKLRASSPHVFIAECKVWRGPKTIRDALAQLLSYLTWIDTKAALLLFIRAGEPTMTIGKAAKEIESYRNYKRTVTINQDGDRYDFVLRASGHPNKEVQPSCPSPNRALPSRTDQSFLFRGLRAPRWKYAIATRSSLSRQADSPVRHCPAQDAAVPRKACRSVRVMMRRRPIFR